MRERNFVKQIKGEKTTLVDELRLQTRENLSDRETMNQQGPETTTLSESHESRSNKELDEPKTR